MSALLLVLFAVILHRVSSLTFISPPCSSLIAAVNGGYVEECLPTWILNLRNAEAVVESHPLCEAWLSNVAPDEYVEKWAKKFSDSICTNSHPDKRVCSRIVWETIEKLIAHGLDSRVVCHMLKPPNGVSQAANLWTEGAKVNIHDGKVYVNASAISCEICVHVIDNVKYLLRQQPVEQKVEAFLYKACRFLGESEPQCNTIIHTDVPALLRWLEHDLSSHGVCHFLRFCTPTEEEKVAPMCPFCSYVMDRIKIQLDQNSTIEQIKSVSQTVCVAVSHWNDVCHKIVESNVPMLVHFLSARLDSRYICEKLHVCPKRLNEINEIALRSKSTCFLCKPIVFTVKLVLEQNGTVSEIEAALDKVCTLLQSGMCKELVNEYVPQVVKLLEQKVDPDTVCELLGLCDPKYGTGVVVRREQPSSSRCPLCLLVLSTVKQENSQDPSFANIARSLSRICPTIGTYMLDCRKIISGNERTIALRLSQEESEQSVCELINACGENEDTGDKLIENNSVPSIKFRDCAKLLYDKSAEQTNFEKVPLSPRQVDFGASNYGPFDEMLGFHQRRN